MPARDYVLPATDAEEARLEHQARLYGGVGFLEAFLAAGPRAVLDVGCGTGYFTRHVGERLLDATVVGVDADDGKLSSARGPAELPNVRFEQADMMQLPFSDASFDLVFSRFVLGHVKDPTAALMEMARVTRPGGQVVAYDMIHDGIWFSPPMPSVTMVLQTTMEVLRQRGAEPNQGLHLAGAMKRAGLVDVRAEVRPHYAQGDDPLFEAYRRNWIDTVRSLDASLGDRFEEGLVESALCDLDHGADFVVEITVLASGMMPAEAP